MPGPAEQMVGVKDGLSMRAAHKNEGALLLAVLEEDGAHGGSPPAGAQKFTARNPGDKGPRAGKRPGKLAGSPPRKEAGQAHAVAEPDVEAAAPSQQAVASTALVYAVMATHGLLPERRLAKRVAASAEHFRDVEGRGLTDWITLFTIMLSVGNMNSSKEWMARGRLWRLVLMQQAEACSPPPPRRSTLYHRLGSSNVGLAPGVCPLSGRLACPAWL